MSEMTVNTQNKTYDVVVLVTPGAQLTSLVGMIESFDAANRFRAARGRPPLYRIHTRGVSESTSTIALDLVTVTSEVDDVHTFVVGGSLDGDLACDPRVLKRAAALADRAERVVSVCTGAFVLGALGLLDGRRCTTHWLRADRLQQCVPLAQVTSDALFVQDGRVFTSAGATAAIDLALHLVGLDGGTGLSRAVARALVVHNRRSGGQSQFGPALQLPRSRDDRLQRLVGMVVRDPAGDHRIEVMAGRVGMSPRHFARVFRDQTGQTPAAFVAAVRVDAAKRMLIDSDVGLDAIADACGFRRGETLRRTFRRVVGVDPRGYRQGFGV